MCAGMELVACDTDEGVVCASSCPELEPSLEPELEPSLEPELEPSLEPDFEPSLEPELELDVVPFLEIANIGSDDQTERLDCAGIPPLSLPTSTH
jgi:hypothetical protein